MPLASASPRGRSPKGDKSRSTLNEYKRRTSPTRRGRSKGSPRSSPRNRNLPGDYMQLTPGAIPPQIAYASPEQNDPMKLSNTRRLQPMSNDQSQKAMAVLEREFGKVFNEAMTTLNSQKTKVNSKIKENGLHDRHLLAKKEDKRSYATFDWHQHALKITMERNQLQQTILSQQRDYDKLFSQLFETTSSIIRTSISRCQKKAMFCVDSFLDRIEEANNALVHADEVEELCNERVQVMEAEFWKKTEVFQAKTITKNEKIIEELQKQIKDAHAAIEAERYASELRAMETKRFEADQRIEKEATVRERYEGIIQNLASENAVIRRELHKEIEKSHTLTNSLMIEFEKRCRNFEKNLIETLLQERDQTSPALHQKLQEHLRVVSDASSYGEPSNPGQQIGEIVATYHDKVYSDLKLKMSGRRPQQTQHNNHNHIHSAAYAESDISWNGSAENVYESQNGSRYFHDEYGEEDYSVDIDANLYLYNGPEPPPPLTEKEKELQREVQIAKMKLKEKEEEVRAKTQKAEERIMKRDMMIYNLERKVKGEEHVYPRYAPPPPPSYRRIEQLKQEEERKKQEKERQEREQWEAERKKLEERQKKKEQELVQDSNQQDSALDEQRRRHHKQLQERRQNRMINRNRTLSNSPSRSPDRLEPSQMEQDLERQKAEFEQQTRQLEQRTPSLSTLPPRSPALAAPKTNSELELQREAQLARIERLERRQREEEELTRLRDQTEERQLKRADSMMSNNSKSESELLKEQIAQNPHLRQMISNSPTHQETLLPSPTEKERMEAEIARQKEMAASWADDDEQRERAMSPANRGRPVFQPPMQRQQSPKRRPPRTPPAAAQAQAQQQQQQEQQQQQLQIQQQHAQLQLQQQQYEEHQRLQLQQQQNLSQQALEDELEAQRLALEKANEAGRIEGEKMRQTKAGRRAKERADKEAKENAKAEQAKKYAENEAVRRRRYTQVLSPEEQQERMKRAQEIRFKEEKAKQYLKAKEKADKDAALAARKQREKSSREVEEKKRQQEDLKKAKKLIAEQKKKKEEAEAAQKAKDAADMETL
ncbi:hypothetical protein TrLO_g2962 [Triparma laevis f. longispina]|uniref:Uncharacterized protein n=1 Tax=Triparma laevis f. longispina TaxID=1714387 RepID=A0A9W7A6X3_9STRA|nr:hypothetical protein TrLO_g2962 [Triparma laevis f. longispina]